MHIVQNGTIIPTKTLWPIKQLFHLHEIFLEFNREIALRIR